jgi:hypothetical protein
MILQALLSQALKNQPGSNALAYFAASAMIQVTKKVLTLTPRKKGI